MISLIVYGFFWLLGFVVFWRIKLLSPGTVDRGETVSVIIPARNETHRLPALLDTLKDQTPLLWKCWWLMTIPPTTRPDLPDRPARR